MPARGVQREPRASPCQTLIEPAVFFQARSENLDAKVLDEVFVGCRQDSMNFARSRLRFCVLRAQKDVASSWVKPRTA